MNNSRHELYGQWSGIEVLGSHCLVRHNEGFRRGVIVDVDEVMGLDTVYHVRLTRTRDNQVIHVLRPYLMISARRVLCTCNEALAVHHEGKDSLCQICYRVNLEKARISASANVDMPITNRELLELHMSSFRNVNDGIDKSLSALNEMRNSAGLSDAVLPSTHPTFSKIVPKLEPIDPNTPWTNTEGEWTQEQSDAAERSGLHPSYYDEEGQLTGIAKVELATRRSKFDEAWKNVPF
jgi:hypothetical protein